jgi:hypothetical protein
VSETAPLSLLHVDEELLVVAKPARLLAHASRIAADVDDDLLDQLRRQFGDTVNLVHRLDRATSGLVLAARTRESASDLGKQFMARTIEKRYLAVCRGWPDESGEIDYPLGDVRPNSPRKPALTRYRRLATVEVPIALGKISAAALCTDGGRSRERPLPPDPQALPPHLASSDRRHQPWSHRAQPLCFSANGRSAACCCMRSSLRSRIRRAANASSSALRSTTSSSACSMPSAGPTKRGRSTFLVNRFRALLRPACLRPAAQIASDPVFSGPVF